MGQFIYLVPEQGAPAHLIERYGLSCRLEEGKPTRGCSLGVGADGGLRVTGEGCSEEFEGTLLGYEPNLKFSAEEQVWERIECEHAEPYWMGYWRGEAPGPEDLSRQQQIPGHTVRLVDGNDWVVPVVRSFLEPKTCLPQLLKMGSDRKLIRTVKEEYTEIFDRASAVAEAMYGEGELTLDEEEFFLLAVDVLALNYRIGVAEVNVLGLLDTGSRQATIRAMVDAPTFEELYKKLQEEREGKKKRD